MGWFKELTASEQKLLTYGSFLVAIALFWAFVVKPISHTLEKKQKQLKILNEQYQEMEDSKFLLAEQQKKSTKFHRDINIPFISWVDKQLEKHSLLNFVTRVEPKDNQTLIITFESVVFDDLGKWLQNLEQNYSIKISEADINLIDRSNGLCNARITLEEKQ